MSSDEKEKHRLLTEAPAEDKDFAAALAVWCEYHVRCEEFDRTLPGSWSRYERDCWMPDPQYRRMSEGYAISKSREVRALLRRYLQAVRDRDELKRLDDVFSKAERVAKQMSHGQCVAYLAEHMRSKT